MTTQKGESKMKFCSGEHSIGDQNCRVSKATITAYLNKPMQYTEMLTFYNIIASINPLLPEHIIRNYNKENATSFGRYKPKSREILIYRSCVWTFLHELAHALQYCVIKDYATSHGRGYCQAIEYVTDQYQKYEHVRKEN